jgi:hypothetical protein
MTTIFLRTGGVLYCHAQIISKKNLVDCCLGVMTGIRFQRDIITLISTKQFGYTHPKRVISKKT